MSVFPSFSPEQLAVLPHDDAGPTLLIVTWLLTALATAFLGLRIYCKVISRRSLYWDDLVLLAAWVALVIDEALATYLVKGFGFGKHIWDLPPSFNLDKFALVITTRATFTIAAISWTKTAIAIMLLRLTEKWSRRFVWFVIISMNIALGLSAFLAWVQCVPLAKSWTPSISGKCFGERILIDYAIFSSAYSACMDCALALLPWKLIWPLQIKTIEKFAIAIAMSMGIFAAGVAITKCVKLPKLLSPDLFDAVDLVTWDITEASVTMIAACIPVLRLLLPSVRASTRRYYFSERPKSHRLSRLQNRNVAGTTISSHDDFSKLASTLEENT